MLERSFVLVCKEAEVEEEDLEVDGAEDWELEEDLEEDLEDCCIGS